ncbi:MAG: aspartate/glutamate racemase family protein [archaeon]|nr:aspartate/glutamate racemase family protein [Nanoarchaeota archaeon]
MKTIGIIGGMSWESTTEYYRIMNEEVKRRLGGLHSANLVMKSFDFDQVAQLQHDGDWESITDLVTYAAQDLEIAKADAIVIATNTIHKVAPRVQELINIPIIHIGDATAKAISADGYTTVGLLGTKFTMEGDFYSDRLQDYGIKTIIPDSSGRDRVHRVIYDELCNGQINETSKRDFQRIINSLKRQGAEGIVLGCTEIPLLIKKEHSSLPIYDTTKIHAMAAIDYALRDNE